MTVRHVVKLGGSLLSRVDWPLHLSRWLESHRDEQILLMVGGGKVIDAIREIDARASLPVDQVHWRCVQLLDATFDIVRWTMPDLKTLDQPSNWEPFVDEPKLRGVWLIRVAAYYVPDVSRDANRAEPETPKNEPRRIRSRLPHDWRTTTDAIAVAMAADAAADRVTLLKSCDPGPNAIVKRSDPSESGDPLQSSPTVIDHWRACGWIDEATPAIAQHFGGTIQLERLPD